MPPNVKEVKLLLFHHNTGQFLSQNLEICPNLTTSIQRLAPNQRPSLTAASSYKNRALWGWSTFWMFGDKEIVKKKWTDGGRQSYTEKSVRRTFK